MVISEIREINVQERVITLNDLRSLAMIIESESRKVSGEARIKLNFFTYCEDNSSFQSEDAAIFEDNSALSRKRVTHVKMEAKSNQFQISIELTHGNDTRRTNRILVQGIDSAWVNGVLKLMEETINSFKPQNTFLYNNKWLIRTTIAIGIGILFIWLIGLLPSPPATEPSQWVVKLNVALGSIPIGYLLFKYFLAYLLGFSPSNSMYEKLLELWPSVELQIGPEHTLTEKSRRKWIAAAFVLGVVPLLTSFAYDVIKGFLIK